jgi:hypothetical protein
MPAANRVNSKYIRALAQYAGRDRSFDDPAGFD